MAPAKVLTVRQPHAGLIAAGIKRKEYRSRRYQSIIGKQIAIHAGKYRPTVEDIEGVRQRAPRLYSDGDLRRARRLLDEDPDSWVYGRIVAVVTVGEPVWDSDWDLWAWPLELVRRTTSRIVTGQPGLFPVPADANIRTVE